MKNKYLMLFLMVALTAITVLIFNEDNKRVFVSENGCCSVTLIEDGYETVVIYTDNTTGNTDRTVVYNDGAEMYLAFYASWCENTHK